MKRAFTLIELLVVVAIIGVLSSVVLVALNTSRVKARDAQRLSHLREVQKALETYANDNGGNYPSTGGVYRSQCSAAGSYAPQNVAPGLVPTYISQFPVDPEMNTAASTCCFYYVSDGKDYGVKDYQCATSDTSNPRFASLKDPNTPSMLWVSTAGAAANGW